MYGKEIKKLRQKRGITQEELAEKLGVTRQTISLWEKNDHEPESENLRTLCDELGVSYDYFWRGEAVVASDSIEAGQRDTGKEIEEIKKSRWWLKILCFFFLGIIFFFLVLVFVLVATTVFDDNKGFETTEIIWVNIPPIDLFCILFVLIVVFVVAIIVVCLCRRKKKINKNRNKKEERQNFIGTK